MSNDEEIISKYLSNNYFNPCDETQEDDETGHELDDSLLVSPLLTDYIGNITARSKSRSTNKKMRNRNSRVKSAMKVRRRLDEKFSNPENDINTSHCSTPDSENGDSMLDASGFSLGLGSPELNMSIRNDKTESRLHEVRDITIFENEEFCDENANNEKANIKAHDEENSNYSQGNLNVTESNEIMYKDVPQSELKDEFKSYSSIQKCDSNVADLDKYIDLNENRLNSEDTNVERISSNFSHEEKENIDLKPTVDMKLSLSPINLKCSDKIAVNIPTESKDEILIHDENVSVPDIINIEKNVIEQKLENSNIINDKIQLYDSNQAVKYVSSSDKRSSNTLKELKNDQRINYENFKFSDTINNNETNSMDEKQDNPDIDGENQIYDNNQDVVSDFTLKYDSSAPINSSREDCNYNVEKGFFFLEDDECNLSRVSEIECCSSVSSTEEVDTDLKLNEANTIKNINKKTLDSDDKVYYNHPAIAVNSLHTEKLNSRSIGVSNYRKETTTIKSPKSVDIDSETITEKNFDKKPLDYYVETIDNDSRNVENSLCTEKINDRNVEVTEYGEETTAVKSSKSVNIGFKDNKENKTSRLDLSPDSLKEKDLKRQKLSYSQDPNISEISSLMESRSDTDKEKDNQKRGPQSGIGLNVLTSHSNAIVNEEHNLRRSYSDSDVGDKSNSIINTYSNFSSMSDDDAGVAELKLKKPGKNERRRRSSIYSRAAERRDSFMSSNPSPDFEEEENLRDLSSVRKKINASSSKLIEKLQGDAQKRKLHFSRSLKYRKYVSHSRSSLDSTSGIRAHHKRDSVISKENKIKTRKEDLSFEVSKSGLTKSSTLKRPSVVPANKPKTSKDADSFIPFKARPVPTDSARCGQAGVPKIETRPVTVPCSPKLGRMDNRPSKAITKIKSEYRNRRRLLTKVPAVRPPPNPSTVKKSALNAKPFQRLLAGSEASRAKELVTKRALEKEESENRKLSMFLKKSVKKTQSNASPASDCNSQNSSLLGIRWLLDEDSANLSISYQQMQENIPPSKGRNRLKKSTKNIAIPSTAKAPPILHSTKRAKQRAEFETHRAALDVLRRNDKERKRQAILKEKTAENNKLRTLL